MNERLLREYVREALVTELRVDHDFINRVYRLTGIRLPGKRGSHLEDRSPFDDVAERWLSDVEVELGHALWPGIRAQVSRYVAQRMVGLVKRFNGNERAAEQTMHNLLNSKFSSLRPSGR